MFYIDELDMIVMEFDDISISQMNKLTFREVK